MAFVHLSVIIKVTESHSGGRVCHQSLITEKTASERNWVQYSTVMSLHSKNVPL